MWPFPVFLRAALAMLVERFMGYPEPLQDRIGHPVEWIGGLINLLDETLNRPTVDRNQGRMRGAVALAILLAVVLVLTAAVSRLLAILPFGWIVEILIATSLIAQRSMSAHVEAVHDGLGQSLETGREAVSRIVGRDPAGLDQSGVAKAALESLAENASDGIVAPLFWYALLGLPGMALYKAINTADSMIGHKSERYLHFGWAAARLDDLVNLPCSRLTGLLFAAAVPHRFGEIVAVMRRDAPRHQSPNAGWPEAAMAAALNLRFGGPRSYEGEAVELAWMGEGRSDLERHDIKRGLRLFDRAMWLLLALLFLTGLVI
jgi:adenosylcobinamide-phosphate synthase